MRLKLKEKKKVGTEIGALSSSKVEMNAIWFLLCNTNGWVSVCASPRIMENSLKKDLPWLLILFWTVMSIIQLLVMYRLKMKAISLFCAHNAWNINHGFWKYWSIVHRIGEITFIFIRYATKIVNIVQSHLGSQANGDCCNTYVTCSALWKPTASIWVFPNWQHTWCRIFWVFPGNKPLHLPSVLVNSMLSTR